MAEHENCLGESDEWYSPPEIFTALNLRFDLDPAAPANRTYCASYQWCDRHFTLADDGLAQTWHGTVFLNPPFGARHGHVPWLRKFLEHGSGIAIVRAYTSADWFHDLVPCAHAVLFPCGKTKFIRGTAMQSVSRKGIVTDHPAGSTGTSPGHGVILLAMGEQSVTALRHSGLGICPPVWSALSEQTVRGAA